MVSLNLLQYRESVKRALLTRKNELDQEWDPFVASWLAYAFVHEEGAQSLLLQETSQRLVSWSNGSSAWEYKRNIGPLLFLIWLSKQIQYPISDSYVEKVIGMFQELSTGRDDRFSPLRFPEQVFLMALGLSALENSQVRNTFTNVVTSQVKGSVARQMLFNAALIELSEKYNLHLTPPKDIADIIVMAWWAERYGQIDKSKCWAQFENIADIVLLNKAEDFDTRRVLSEWELVLLYEALIRQTSKPDPNMLFDYYPLHPRIRQIAESDFKNGNYFGAVFEACKVLEDYLKTVSGSTSIGVRLVSEVLGKPDMDRKSFSPPTIKINPLDQTSVDFVTQLDEQKGFSALATGIFQAFRNPKGHQPKDKGWVGINAYESLDQLVVISLVMKQIEDAVKSNP